jgi:hypothetical protein
VNVITSFLASDIRTSTPLILAGIGLVFSERSGVVNIGAEGMMLVGAFVGVMISYYTSSALCGALAAMLSGLLIALLFAFICITLKANQIIAGTAINILASGFTVTMNRLVFGLSTSVNIIESYQPVPIPLLSDLPVIGDSLFHQTVVGYIAFLLVPISYFIMQRTKIGLRIRSVGENPKACATLGIHIIRLRYVTVMLSGLLCGLAGSFISMGLLSAFTEDMVAGRGFIVIAAVVFGNYTPVGVMLACLLFGAASALQYRLMAINSIVPYQFWTMIPYVITTIALCAYKTKSNQPAASGRPYDKEE